MLALRPAPLLAAAPPARRPANPFTPQASSSSSPSTSGDSQGEWRKNARSQKGAQYENANRRRGRPAWRRSPDDSPLRDGNRDRLIGFLTERAAKTLVCRRGREREGGRRGGSAPTSNPLITLDPRPVSFTHTHALPLSLSLNHTPGHVLHRAGPRQKLVAGKREDGGERREDGEREAWRLPGGAPNPSNPPSFTSRAPRTYTLIPPSKTHTCTHLKLAFIRAYPIPRDEGNWEDISGATFLRKLLSLPVGSANVTPRRADVYEMTRRAGINPREVAASILTIRTQLAAEFAEDLGDVAEENAALMREVAAASLAKTLASMESSDEEDGGGGSPGGWASDGADD